MAEYKDLTRPEPDLPERNLIQRYRAFPQEADGSEISSYLRTYWNILLKRRWTILALTLVVTTLVAIYAFKTKPIYQATSNVDIEAEPAQFQTVQNLDVPQPTDDTFLATQVNVLSSNDLAWETIEQLHLDANPETAHPSSKVLSNSNNPDAIESYWVQVFKKALSVQLLDGTRIIQVSFESPDPRLAARVVNTLVRNYTEYNFRTKYDATRQASAWMEQRLDELKAKVEKSQQALVDYERNHSIVAIGGNQNVMEQRLGSLSKDLTEAQNDLAQKQSLYQLAQANPAEVGVLVQDALLQQLQGKIGDLQTEYVNTLAQYGPNFPKVVRLRDQMQQIRSLMEQERKQVLERVRHDDLAAVGREKILAAAVDRETATIGNASQLLIQENILKHEFQTNQDLYDGLLMHVKNAMVSAGMHANNVHVIDHALVPGTPVRPRKGREIAVGLLVGLMMGITVAFVQEGLDNSVKNAEDIERYIPAPALAVIPLAASVRPRRSWLPGNRRNFPVGNGSIALAVAKTPSSPLAESFRTLRTSILLSTAPRPPQTILVTSSQPGEGKTSTSLNLAQSLAQRGGKVLIIDGDLRKPGIAEALGLKEKKGLSGLLTGAYTFDEALIHVEAPVDLWALTSGPHPPNPAELLSSPTMERLLKELCGRYDYILLDSPPLLAVTDATVLSALVDGVILVVESGVTPRNALVRSFRMLQDAGGRVLGTVINKMDLRHDGYYGYSYRHYYGTYHHAEGSGAEEPVESPVGSTERL
ncbi:MAG TPA: polysaccharide biosynthesis tyrosine autokinase [Terriglobia bacterium]|nr:polysaccharide biosynthesis tyrosine autokinase [Terriglobia bacterium]